MRAKPKGFSTRAASWGEAKRLPRWEPRARDLSYVAYGFVLGVLMWTAAIRLGIDAIPDLRSPNFVLLAGVAGAVLARTRARFVFGGASTAVCLALLAVMYTPFPAAAARGGIREDPLAPLEAVVVLAPRAQADGTLTDLAQARFIRAYELLQQGYARRLVLTRRIDAERPALPAVSRQMALLRFSYPVEEVGPAENTYDEALAVASLARRRGWQRVILVSHPTHMRRAAAALEKAGVRVICAPCDEGRYDLASLSDPDDRLAAFRDWLHEAVGYQVYRLRGWV